MCGKMINSIINVVKVRKAGFMMQVGFRDAADLAFGSALSGTCAKLSFGSRSYHHSLFSENNFNRLPLISKTSKSFISIAPGHRIMSSTSSPDDETILIAVPEVQSFIVRCLKAAGAKSKHAEDMADVLVEADRRGHFSHGLNRLEMYVRDLKSHLTAADREPEIVNETESTALVDGHNLLGAVVGNFAMDLAIEKAKKTGVGFVAARGSNHFGIAGWYSMRAIQHGMIGMSFTNASPLIVATRSKTAVLGTNPLSVAAPATNDDSFVLDMATSAVALGKIEVQHRKQQPMPSGWALDSDGKMTTDPAEALKSWLLLPLGGEESSSGYKGYGLAMMVEVLCGVLSGASFGPHIRKWDKPDGPANLGQCFVALNPKVFAPGFEERMSDLMDYCRNLTPVEQNKSVLIPGDPERQHMAKVNENSGIRYHKNVIKVYAASLSRPVSEAEVFKGAYDQWLVADLRELCTSCLPPNLTDKKKVMLDGHFTLQVNSLRDISRPAYQQYLKLKGVNTSNSEVSADDSVVPSKVESNANRVLRLEVTDGTQNISAMEYQPMPFINLNMAPGTKILVFGKVMCRYGVLYLTKENICVLGGDVEELVQRNKQIKVLRNVLNLPEENETTCDNRINNQHVPTPRTEESEIGKLSSEKSTITTNRPASMESSTSSSVTTTANDENLAWNDMDDDDFVFDNDFDKMAACNKRKSSSLCTGSVLPRKKAGQTAANSSDDLRHSPLATVNKSSSRVETARESSSDNLLNDVFDDYDDFVFEDIVMDENPLVTKSMTVSSVRSKAPYEYLCHLPPLPATERRSIRVKAFILTLLSVIDCNKGQRWQLKAEITDGSAKLPVEFADEVISTLIGMTASEYFTLKQLSKGSEEARKRKDMLMKQAKQRLINLSCLMDLVILPGGTSATIISLLEVDQATLSDLQARLT